MEVFLNFLEDKGFNLISEDIYEKDKVFTKKFTSIWFDVKYRQDWMDKLIYIKSSQHNVGWFYINIIKDFLSNEYKFETTIEENISFFINSFETIKELFSNNNYENTRKNLIIVAKARAKLHDSTLTDEQIDFFCRLED